MRSAHENVRGKLMDSIKKIMLILRFMQLFVADTTALFLAQMRMCLNKEVKDEDKTYKLEES